MPTDITRRTVLKSGAASGALLLAPVALSARQQRLPISDGDRRGRLGNWWARPVRPGDSGRALSRPETTVAGEEWLSAVVPGTVLTSLVAAGQAEDPYFGTNNDNIVDVHDEPDRYTYWYLTDFEHVSSSRAPSTRNWLRFRGINYAADVYLNGLKINETRLEGMFLRHEIDVTEGLRPGANRLVVRVEPPLPPGNPIPKTPRSPGYEPGMASVCQGEGGLLGRSVTAQFSGGWDFVHPVRDRNTGIWDEVVLIETGAVSFGNRIVDPKGGAISYVTSPRITTRITWEGDQAKEALVTASMLLRNSVDRAVTGRVTLRVGEVTGAIDFSLVGGGELELDVQVTIRDPDLWWPNGHGRQHLYDVDVDVVAEGRVSDCYRHKLGIREIHSAVDGATDGPDNAGENGRVFSVNRKRIFIRGGCWTFSDAMLRHSAQDYDDQIRHHAMMNLNLIRIWGGGITERPEFYEACDRYGLLVWQEFWITADCNHGDQNPEDHVLFMRSAIDAIALIRNFASLALWVGGNEGPPPGDLDARLAMAIAVNDPGRNYISYSTDPKAGLGLHGTAFSDGPYGIIEPKRFFTAAYTPHHRTSTGTPVAYNPEYGSVGMPVADSVRLFMAPRDYNQIPDITQKTWPSLNPSWIAHSYIPFFHDVEGTTPTQDQIDLYGKPTTLDAFCEQAQAAQYQQYKALLEGRNSHMWTGYTGGNIWRSAPGWPVLRGGLYDGYLEATGGYFGARLAGQPKHVQLNLADGTLQIVNNTSDDLTGLEISVAVCDASGRRRDDLGETIAVSSPVTANGVTTVGSLRALVESSDLHIVRLELREAGRPIARNLDWLVNSDSADRYSALRRLSAATLAVKVSASDTDGDTRTVHLNAENRGDIIAFFVRLQVVTSSGDRVLPVFASDNYLSLLPGEAQDVSLGLRTNNTRSTALWLSGWNVESRTVQLA
ncbi:MAG: hypothetical protein GY798_23860 [Hyphomicrobiales bacterium]|nr:hypothetical protein [Hyphomicrobiales bacterium]